MILCDSWPHRGANHFALKCGWHCCAGGAAAAALERRQVGPAGRARAAPRRSRSRCMAEGGGAPGHVVLLLAPHQQQPLRLRQPSLQHLQSAVWPQVRKRIFAPSLLPKTTICQARLGTNRIESLKMIMLLSQRWLLV
eukprot:COSAG06_NODE_5069_length_3749_cov_9.249315_4_plen_138_part_00